MPDLLNGSVGKPAGCFIQPAAILHFACGLERGQVGMNDALKQGQANHVLTCLPRPNILPVCSQKWCPLPNCMQNHISSSIAETFADKIW